jgi:hypothetical protein
VVPLPLAGEKDALAVPQDKGGVIVNPTVAPSIKAPPAFLTVAVAVRVALVEVAAPSVRDASGAKAVMEAGASIIVTSMLPLAFPCEVLTEAKIVAVPGVIPAVNVAVATPVALVVALDVTVPRFVEKSTVAPGNAAPSEVTLAVIVDVPPV